MKITFFEAKPRGRADAAAGLSVRQKGRITLNKAAVKLLEAEAGEAASLGYDEESQRWLLAHWPNGKAGQPELRGATASSKESLRFQVSAATSAFYEKLPPKERQRSSVQCTLAEESFQDAGHPGCSFWQLNLPQELTEQAKGKGGNRG